jgi:hypothetical protein
MTGDVLADIRAQFEDSDLYLDDVQELLEGLHAGTGWDYGITITAVSHVAWNVTLRVTPQPFAPGESDRSITTHRVGPPDWALAMAFGDMLTWLEEIKPPAAPKPCFACPEDDEQEPQPSGKNS